MEDGKSFQHRKGGDHTGEKHFSYYLFVFVTIRSWRWWPVGQPASWGEKKGRKTLGSCPGREAWTANGNILKEESPSHLEELAGKGGRVRRFPIETEVSWEKRKG